MSMVFLASCLLPPSSFHVSSSRAFRASELQIFVDVKLHSFSTPSWKVWSRRLGISNSVPLDIWCARLLWHWRFNGATVQGFFLVAPGACRPWNCAKKWRLRSWRKPSKRRKSRMALVDFGKSKFVSEIDVFVGYLSCPLHVNIVWWRFSSQDGVCRICHEKDEQDDLGVFCDCKGSLAVSAICQMNLVIARKT